MTDQKTLDASGASLLSDGLGVNEHYKASLEYERMSTPLLREKAEIWNTIKMIYVLKRNGAIEIIPSPTFGQIELLNQIDEILRYMQNKCFTPNV